MKNARDGLSRSICCSAALARLWRRGWAANELNGNMSSNPQTRGSPAQPAAGAETDRKLAEKVAQRVYELWREDLRREQERRGKKNRR
jgi:hypothetical protein